MKLQKQRTREVKGKEYHRWTVVIPPEEVKKLGWREGEELEGNIKDGRLILQKIAKS